MRVRARARVAIVSVVAVIAAAFAVYESVRYLRGRHHLAQARAALARRGFQEASSELNRYLEIWPHEPEVLLLAAQAARRGGDFEAAQAHLRTHQQDQGPAQERFWEQQLLFIQRGDLLDADRLLDHCLRDPPTPDGYLILDVVLPAKITLLERAYLSGMTLVEGPAGRERARLEQGLDLWLRQFPAPADQVQGLIWRGRVRMLTNVQDAVADFRRALALAPDHFEARLHLASALAENDPREAAQHLRLLWQREPRNQQSALLLAGVLRNLGQGAEARQVLDAVLAANPDHAGALLERGKVALDMAQPTDAERFLERAATLAPQEPFVHLALSRCLQLTGRAAEASAHEKRYRELEAQKTQERQTREQDQRTARTQRERQP